MSSFPGAETPRAADLASSIIGRDPSLPLQQDERRLLERLLGEPAALPQTFWAALIDRMVVELPHQIPIYQLQGFQQFSATSATILTGESTTSGTYTNLATTGPEITGLSKGKYLIFFGAGACNTGNTLGWQAAMSLSINSAAASENDRCMAAHQASSSAGTVSISRTVEKTLSQESNTVTCKYRLAFGGTAFFEYRWLIVQRIGNA